MTTKQFLLPDLGEGLPDATVVEWYVKVGDTIKLDDNLVSMETAKAVVDVPSPVSGKVLKIGGGAGDVIVTGTMLAEFEIDPSMPQRAEGQDTGHHHGPPKGAGAHVSDDKVVASDEGGVIDETDQTKTESVREDSGTVVGAMQSSDAVRSEAAVAVGGVKALPAVRALARKLGVDIARVRATGPDGVVTNAGCEECGGRWVGEDRGCAKAGCVPAFRPSGAGAPTPPAGRSGTPARSTLSQAGQADAHAAAGRAGVGPAGTTQGRAPQHGARDGRCAFEGRADHAQRRRRHPRLGAGQRHHRPPRARHRRRREGRAGAQRVVRRRGAHAHAASACRHRHRGRHRRRPVRPRAAQRRHARRTQRARSRQPPAHAGRRPHDPDVGTVRLHDLVVELRHVRRSLCDAGDRAADASRSSPRARAATR